MKILSEALNLLLILGASGLLLVGIGLVFSTSHIANVLGIICLFGGGVLAGLSHNHQSRQR